MKFIELNNVLQMLRRLVYPSPEDQLLVSTDDAHNSGDRAKKYLFHFFGLQVNYSIYEFGDHRSCLKIVSPSHVKAKFSHKNQNRHSRGPSKLTYFLNLWQLWKSVFLFHTVILAKTFFCKIWRQSIKLSIHEIKSLNKETTCR